MKHPKELEVVLWRNIFEFLQDFSWLLQNFILPTSVTFIILMILETIGREHQISYLRVTKLLVPLSTSSIRLFKWIGNTIAYYLGQPLVYLYYNLADLVKRYLYGIYQSFIEIITPLIEILVSPFYIIIGYFQQGSTLIRYYLGTKYKDYWSWYGLLLIISTLILPFLTYKASYYIYYQAY